MPPKRLNKEELLAELKLVEAAKANPSRFGILYERYFKQIFLFIIKRVEDEDICADITQQVFLKAMVNLKKYQFKGVPFSAWLYRIASNEVNMFFRANKNQRTITLEPESVFNMMEIASKGENQPQLRDHYETALIEVLDNLEDGDIQLVELRYFEKKSFAEVGFILGITENNAKVRAFRILKRLKKKLLDKAGRPEA